MFKKITLKGLASQKSFEILIHSSEDLSQSLLDLLRSKDIPIASSCNGKGACKKCVVNQDLLSCQISVIKFLEKEPLLEVSYL